MVAPLSLFRGWTLAMMAVAVPPLAVFASKGLAALFIGGAGVLVVATRTLPRVSRWLVVYFGLLLAWGALTSLWSVAPLQSLFKDAQLLGGVLAGLVLLDAGMSLEEDGRRILRRGLVAGAVLALALLGVEGTTDALITRVIHGVTPLDRLEWRVEKDYSPFLKNGAAMAAVMAWPAVVAMAGRGAAMGAWAVLAALFAVLVPTNAHTAAVAMAAGILVFPIARLAPRLVAGAIAGGLAVGLVLAPVVPVMLPPPHETLERMPAFVPNSIHHRLVIWRFVAGHIAEQPLAGHGLDASRSMPGGSDKVAVDIEIPGRGRLIALEEMLPLHPHNSLLQIWLELGAPGAALALALVVLILRRLPTALPGREERAAALALIVVTLLIASSSYGVFQSWWLGAVWMAAAFTVGAARKEHGLSQDPRT
ncbi:MAG: O-antigen ligase family protein [Alphaproteobacteria bacterium]